MRKIIEWTVAIVVVLSLLITFAIDRLDKYNLGSSREYIKQDTLVIDSVNNESNQNIIEEIQSLDSLVKNDKKIQTNLVVKTKQYRDSLNVLNNLNQREDESYQKKVQEYEQELDILKKEKELMMKEKELIHSKYMKEKEFNKKFNTFIRESVDTNTQDSTFSPKKD